MQALAFAYWVTTTLLPFAKPVYCKFVSLADGSSPSTVVPQTVEGGLVFQGGWIRGISLYAVAGGVGGCGAYGSRWVSKVSPAIDKYCCF